MRSADVIHVEDHAVRQAPRSVWLISESDEVATLLTSAAASLEIPFRRIEAADMNHVLRGSGYLLLDLDPEPETACDIIRMVPRGPRPALRVWAFGAQIDSRRLIAAREAGADRVLSLSRLLTGLEDLLREVVASGS